MRNKTIFTVVPEGQFFGRTALMEKIYSVAVDLSHPPCGLILKGGRWIGKTEVLRRTHRDLFWNQGLVVPVYYQFSEPARLEDFAGHFMAEVIKQFLAFKRRDPGLALGQLTLKKIRGLLTDEGLMEAASLITAHLDLREVGEPRALIRNALRIVEVMSRETGSPAFLLLDDIDRAVAINLYEDGPGIMNEIAAMLKSVAFVASRGPAAKSEGLAGEVYSETMEIYGLPGHESRAMIEELLRGYGLSFEPEVVSAAAGRLGGNPFYIREMVRALSTGPDRALKTLKGFAALYVMEITTGTLGTALGHEFSGCGRKGLRALRAIMAQQGPVGIDDLSETLGLEAAEMEQVVSILESLNLLSINLGSLRCTSDAVVRDYIEYISATGLLGKSREETRTWMIRDVLKAGYSGLGRGVKQRFRQEIMSVMRAFDGQELPETLFRLNAGGKDAGEGADETLLALPSVTGCFGASAFEKYETGLPVLIAHGFAPGRFDSSGEVLWLVGLKESDTVINTGDVENFLRRSRILQREFCPARVIRWLVGKKGFSSEAILRLSEDGPAYTSDGAGLAAIKKLVSPVKKECPEGGEPVRREFEMVLPPSRNSELVAVRGATEISAEMGFDEDSIGRIKTSVVEACINAFEHSGSPPSKVHLRFVADLESLTIYVSNPGFDFDGAIAAQPAAGGAGGLPQKRGWGLELMKGLMDEVRFESLEGGTRLVLVKYLDKKGEDGHG
ncbi:MAG: ATP-binding protein [Thermodesulfobacteriota bacterium]